MKKIIASVAIVAVLALAVLATTTEIISFAPGPLPAVSLNAFTTSGKHELFAGPDVTAGPVGVTVELMADGNTCGPSELLPAETKSLEELFPGCIVDIVPGDMVTLTPVLGDATIAGGDSFWTNIFDASVGDSSILFNNEQGRIKYTVTQIVSGATEFVGPGELEFTAINAATLAGGTVVIPLEKDNGNSNRASSPNNDLKTSWEQNADGTTTLIWYIDVSNPIYRDIANDEDIDFEIVGRASGWSGGTIQWTEAEKNAAKKGSSNIFLDE